MVPPLVILPTVPTSNLSWRDARSCTESRSPEVRCGDQGGGKADCTFLSRFRPLFFSAEDVVVILAATREALVRSPEWRLVVSAVQSIDAWRKRYEPACDDKQTRV